MAIFLIAKFEFQKHFKSLLAICGFIVLMFWGMMALWNDSFATIFEVIPTEVNDSVGFNFFTLEGFLVSGIYSFEWVLVYLV